nr:integrase, catalytic region, zinc finger, CCHC-type, peptidase aspartic, catalytic [Tanacetum cinerariifolium]
MDIDEIETINIELEHRVIKLIAENEHLKQTYKQLYDLIKPSRIQAKEHVESLVNLLNQKDTCLDVHKPSKKLVVVTPINKKKTVRHELCFLEFIFDMNTSSKSKSVKKAKRKEEWNPTRKVFTKIGYDWRPTERTFTLVGNACPLTRITATNKVPLREPIPLKVVAQESVVTKVYTRRPKVPKTNGSNSKPKIAKFVISNKTKPSTSWESNTPVAPSSSSIDLSTVKFVNIQIVKIIGYGDYQIGNITILEVGISHETSVVRTLQQDGVVEKRNRTLVEATCTIKPDLSYLYVFGALCYPNNDSENLGKLQAKANIVPVAAAPRVVDLSYSLCLRQLTNMLHQQGSSSNVRPIHTLFESLTRWTKDHPIANVIDDPSRSVFTENNYKLTPYVNDEADVILFRITNFSKSQRHLPKPVKYASEIIKKYGMLTSDSVDTPLVEKSKLDEDLQGKPVDTTLYDGMI